MKILIKYLLKHQRLFETLAAILFIVLSCWGIFSLVFKTPDMEVIVTVSDANLPNSISQKYDKSILTLINKVPNRRSEPDVKKAAEDIEEVSNFLEKTKNKVTFEITNNSKINLNNIDIRIKNINDLTAWGVSGTTLQSIESSEILKTMHEDPQTGVITFACIEKIPPKTKLVITIWGKVKLYYFDDPVSITYDGGFAKVIRSTTVKGFSSFIIDNFNVLVFFMIILNIGLFLFICDRTVNKNEKSEIKNTTIS